MFDETCTLYCFVSAHTSHTFSRMNFSSPKECRNAVYVRWACRPNTWQSTIHHAFSERIPFGGSLYFDWRTNTMCHVPCRIDLLIQRFSYGISPLNGIQCCRLQQRFSFVFLHQIQLLRDCFRWSISIKSVQKWFQFDWTRIQTTLTSHTAPPCQCTATSDWAHTHCQRTNEFGEKIDNFYVHGGLLSVAQMSKLCVCWRWRMRTTTARESRSYTFMLIAWHGRLLDGKPYSRKAVGAPLCYAETFNSVGNVVSIWYLHTFVMPNDNNNINESFKYLSIWRDVCRCTGFTSATMCFNNTPLTRRLFHESHGIVVA